jgi:hypothetical protein
MPNIRLETDPPNDGNNILDTSIGRLASIGLLTFGLFHFKSAHVGFLW